MYFKLYKSENQWRWTLIAANNKKIANSGESYWNKQDAVDAIERVRGTDRSTPIREE